MYLPFLLLLTWQYQFAVSGDPTFFVIERKEGSGGFAQIAEVHANIASGLQSINFQDNATSSGHTYTYRVAGKNFGGQDPTKPPGVGGIVQIGPWSNETTATEPIPTAPLATNAPHVALSKTISAPTDLQTAQLPGNQIQLTWVSTAGGEPETTPTAYDIESTPTGYSQTWQFVASVPASQLAYVDTRVETPGFGIVWYYRVWARNKSGRSATFAGPTRYKPL